MIEVALRSMADDNGAVELEEFVVSGKSRIMVLNIDRTGLWRELPETAQHQQQQNEYSADVNGVMAAMGRPVLRPMSDAWMLHGDSHM